MPAVLEMEPLTLPFTTLPNGTVRIRGTRIPLEMVVHCYDRGETPEMIVDNFDTLKLADVYATLAYVLQHRAEVDAYIQEQEHKAAEVRAKIESMPGYWEGRARLIARKEAWLKAKQAGETAE